MEDNKTARKKIIFSGIQPSGKITLGNYLGAIKHWVALQKDYRCLFCAVDLHAITLRQEPAQLRRQTLELLAQLMACGIDPSQNDTILFVQSHVHQHAELAWVLDCHTMFGELSRMTQFKEKSARAPENINAGLFTYPALMAADILLYNTDAVPVGDDQRQHLELTRDIAGRFNSLYGQTFTLPEPIIPEVGARIMSLMEPTKKMSKSDPNENAYILLTDPPDVILRKIKRAVTDSGSEVRLGEGKEGIANLMNIYAVATGKTFEEIQAQFEGKGYGVFKSAVAEAVIELLRPVRQRTQGLLEEKNELLRVCKDGAERAGRMASRTLEKVHRKIGFIRRV